jgi:hypothetical protein
VAAVKRDPSYPSADDLAERWTLAPDERLLVFSRTSASGLGFTVLLKFFQAEGRFPWHPQEAAHRHRVSGPANRPRRRRVVALRLEGSHDQIPPKRCWKECRTSWWLGKPLRIWSSGDAVRVVVSATPARQVERLK